LVARELRWWRRRATAIPSRALRDDALDSLDSKRTNTDGAAVFATLLPSRHRNALLLLALYQALWDYLDSSVERHPTEANGRELHRALVEALEPGAPISDYYRHHPWRDDGGYLVGMVEQCRARCRRLPSYGEVRATVIAEARRAEVQALNHLPDRATRDGALREWSRRDAAPADGAYWFEVTAAASASLVILPLLALGADRLLTAQEVAEARAGYWPWVTVVTTMLDNYADQDDDASSGNHNYFTHYPTSEDGVERLCGGIRRVLGGLSALPNGDRHVVVIAAMVAMYLSKTGNGTGATRSERRRLARAGGPLVRVLVPVLRLWRVAYGVAAK
jgi:tetraprenyl-beta-curcumene synthase